LGKDVIRSTALSAALLVGLLAGCNGTSDGGSSQDIQPSEDGWQRGELAVYTADGVDGRSETTYYLRNMLAGAAFDTKLVFDSEPSAELVTGVKVKLRGVETPDGLRVIDYQIVPAVDATETSALIGATPYAARSFAFVLINLNGNGVNTDASTVMGRLINNPDSIRNYYLDDSYAMQDITAQVFGPINYTMATCSNSDSSKLASDLRPMITGTFNHYLWYLGTSTGSPCTWGGLGSTSCVVLVQEPGHNFGMQHSSSLACGTSAAFLDDPNGCTDSEYGDRFDPMGGGCRHMNAWQKQYQGWFGGCNGVKVTNTGTFTLLPFEPQCNGVQFLQIAMPKSRPYNRPAGGGGAAGVDTLVSYYVELRTPVDFDGTLGNSSSLSARVLIHAGAAPGSRTKTGIHTYLLDMNPSTTGQSGLNDAGLSVGQTFNDPAGGLSITNMATSNSSATIQVTYTAGSGSPTCLDGTTFNPPGPTDCGMGNTTGTGGAGGSTGTGGAGGATGTGGSTGAGGRGGTTGAGGSGGSGTGTGGRGGTTGSGGSTGAGGSGTGTGGRGGTTGAAGNGSGSGGSIIVVTGTAGSSGGSTGAAGSIGSGGSINTGAAGNGSSGTAGATGAAGTGMVTGKGGTDAVTGSAGSTGTAGTGVVSGAAGAIATGLGGHGGDTPGEIKGGCSCETAGGGTSSGLAAMLALACVAIGRARSPRRRRNQPLQPRQRLQGPQR
jgi:hypothetical protein